MFIRGEGTTNDNKERTKYEKIRKLKFSHFVTFKKL